MKPPAPGSAEVGLVGLAVMGRNLALNIADHGFRIAVYNRTPAATEQFVAANPPGVLGPGGALIGAAELKDFVGAIKRPRRIVLLIKAGPPTDSVIESLVPLLERGDCIIDGGNSLWTDTERRETSLKERGILFVGSGVSGGEVGARFGPSLMPGGTREAYELIRPIWEAIAAKVDEKTGKPLEDAAPGRPVKGGVPCTTYIGPGGSGHFVKMVHNGIEYGDMQLICEAYHFMRDVLELDAPRMADVFAEWNAGDLDSYLIQITADILRQKDPAAGGPLVDVVLDAAGQKGTGKWTIEAALDFGTPAPTMAEAVFARAISALKDERVAASRTLKGPHQSAHAHSIGPGGREPNWIDCVRDALYCSKICSYAQGFALMAAAGRERKWALRLGEIASIFRGGCIIRARFLQKITEAYARGTDLPNLLLDAYFAGVIDRAQQNWRAVAARAAVQGVPVPAFASALAYYDSYRLARLPANLLQAMRDYFGSHTYERVDRPRGEFFHLDWTAPGRPQVDAASLSA
jgi:6-phosphogluconate dehydrogenase